MGQLFANGARAALSAGIAAGDTTLTIASGGALFPIANTDTGAVGGSLDWYKAVLDDGTNFEIVYIRTHTSASTSFTNVLRAQEGTTALSFAAGAVLGVRVTAEDMRLSVGREMLTAARTYYVRTAPAAVSFTASSANVTWAAHGLSVNAAVVLSILPNTGTFTVTLASPGVFTKVGHGYAAGRPVKFSTTGALPTGLTASTTYYVIATGLTADAFQVSATVGGAAVNTSGSQSGTHYAEATGAMPTFSTAGLLVAGTVYYVKTVVDANNVTLSTTTGGTAIGTCTVATGSPVYSASTGSDSNSGLTNSISGALLTAQKAVDIISGALDIGIYGVAVQLAESLYTAPIVCKSCVGSAGVTLLGSSAANAANVTLSTTSANAVGADFCATRYAVKWLKMQTAISGRCLSASNGSQLSIAGPVVFGACAGEHMYAETNAVITAPAIAYTVTGGATIHMYSAFGGYINGWSAVVTLVGVPAFTVAYAYQTMTGLIFAISQTFAGTATGTRYAQYGNSVIQNGGVTTFFPGNGAGSTNSGSQYY